MGLDLSNIHPGVFALYISGKKVREQHGMVAIDSESSNEIRWVPTSNEGDYIFNEFKDKTLADWEDEFPDLKNRRYVRMDITLSITQNGVNVEIIHEVSTWTWVKSINYDTADGYMSNYPITDIPVRFDDVKGVPFKPSKSDNTKYLYADINHFTGLPFVDYVGVITWTDTDINWGFNRMNAVIRFKELIDKYQSVNREGKPYVSIKWLHGVGYWFGDLKKETIESEQNAYYNKETGKVEIPDEG